MIRVLAAWSWLLSATGYACWLLAHAPLLLAQELTR